MPVRVFDEGRVGAGFGLWAGCLRDAVVLDPFDGGVDDERETVPRGTRLDVDLVLSDIAGGSVSAVRDTSVNAWHRI